MIGADAAVQIIELVAMRLGDDVPPPLQTLRRVAWLPREEAMPLEAVVALAAGLPGVTLDAANVAPQVVFGPAFGWVLLNLLILAADSLPNGGDVALAGSAEDVFVRTNGPSAALPANFAAIMTDDAAALAALPTKTGFQAALTVLLARQKGLRLSFVMPPSRQPAPPILRLST